MDSSYPDSSNLVSSCGFCGVCRKQTKSKNFRKRYLDEDQEEDSGSETILFNKKKSLIHDNKLHICSKKSHGETNENQTVFQFESSSETHVENDSRATTEMNFRVVTGGLHGPLKGSNNIRVSTRFDYQLDICKDYKETGYCGYGDSCKFMHDRGDYKSGWQMEKEWDENDKARKRKLALKEFDVEEDVEQSDDEDDDLLPYACLICRQPFVDPVVTKCKYYFCEHCALKHHEKNKTCFVCNTPTLGIFNTAHEIRKKMTAEGKTCLILYICSTLCMYLLTVYFSGSVTVPRILLPTLWLIWLQCYMWRLIDDTVSRC